MQSSTKGYLGCFQLSVIMNNASLLKFYLDMCFPRGCSVLHSYQQCVREKNPCVLSHTYWPFQGYEVQSYCTCTLHFFLAADDIGQLSMKLVDICISSLEKFLCELFAILKLGYFQKCSFYMDLSPLSNTLPVNIFSHSA